MGDTLQNRKKIINFRIDKISKRIGKPLIWYKRSSVYPKNHTLGFAKKDKYGDLHFSGSYFMGGTGTFYSFAEFEAYIDGIYDAITKIK